MINYWTNFAKTGNPNGNDLPQWHAFSKESPEEMYFSESGSCNQIGKNYDAFLRVWER